MIVFDKLWNTMKKKGISTYRLREDYGFNTKTIAKLRQNGNVTTATLNKLCSMLYCDISEISEYRKDWNIYLIAALKDTFSERKPISFSSRMIWVYLCEIISMAINLFYKRGNIVNYSLVNITWDFIFAHVTLAICFHH